MTGKAKKTGKKSTKEESEVSRMQKDLSKKETEGGFLEEDLKCQTEGKTRMVSCKGREEPEYKGVKLYYYKFSSKLKKALGK